MLSFLGSEVGRGHPFYLDGLVQALERAGRADLTARRSDVFALSRGLCGLAWRGIRGAYHVAGQGGALESLYRRLRRGVEYDARSPFSALLGRDLRRWAGRDGIVVVDHPVLVGALGGRPDVWYLHGEHAAPPESIARDAARVFVPTPATAKAFEAGGMPADRIVVTGLCIEPELAEGAEASVAARRARIASADPLCVAFFSSGAEPARHVAALAAGAASLAEATQRVLVFARRGGRLERAVHASPARARIELLRFDDRAGVDRLTARHFDAIDVVVSPPHERSNWALGLGVPFLLVGPDVGPFAPLNRALLLASVVAHEVADAGAAARLDETLAQLRGEGALLGMSQNGGGRPIDGFAVAARALLTELEER